MREMDFTKGPRETLGGHGFVHYLNCGSDFMGVYSSSCYFKYVWFVVHQLYVNKAVKYTHVHTHNGIPCHIHWTGDTFLSLTISSVQEDVEEQKL